MKRETIFSQCRKYRYTLWREFETEFLFDGGNKMKEGFVQFIGLNPSTADENNNDPTIRRCIQFAKDWGYGALCMTNLFAFRSTEPKMMKLEADPRGETGLKNDEWIFHLAQSAALVIAAWGRDGKHIGQGDTIRSLLHTGGIKLHHLGLNDDGTPKHPLYLRSETKPILFNFTPGGSR